MGVFSFNKEKNFKKAFAQESQRQKEFTKTVDVSTTVLDEDNYRYKLLMKKLQKFDNEKADAIRMAFYFLENEYSDIDNLEKYLE